MEQILLSLEDAAIIHAQQYAPANHPIFNARVDAFKDGAEWQKEQDKELLKWILGGLPLDEELNNPTTIHEVGIIRKRLVELLKS